MLSLSSPIRCYVSSPRGKGSYVTVQELAVVLPTYFIVDLKIIVFLYLKEEDGKNAHVTVFCLQQKGEKIKMVNNKTMVTNWLWS